MRILHRYFIKGFIWPLLFCNLTLIVMFIFVDSLNNLDEFIKNEASIKIIAAYYLYMIPLVISQTLPAATLMAALYLLGHLNKNNEITAMKASGTSGLRILLPLLIMGLVLSMGLLFLNESVTPRAAVISTAIKRGILESDQDALKNKSLKNVTLLSKGNKMVYARELRLDTRTLHDVIILEHHPDLSLKTKTAGKRGVYENDQWTLYEVVDYELDAQGKITGKPRSLQKKVTNIHENPDQFIRQDTETSFMNYKQLRSYIKSSHITGRRQFRRLQVDLHKKLASPFTCFIILMVGAPIALGMHRGGMFVSAGVGISVVTCYYVIIAVATALGKGGGLSPLASAWLPHGIFFLVGCYLVRKYI
jgi:lipopolysaccharide export system permease protein